MESATSVLDWKVGCCWIVDESLNILVFENMRRIPAKNLFVEFERESIPKSQFLAVMSDEIRTPLIAIIGLGELATEMDSEPIRVEFLEIMQKTAFIHMNECYVASSHYRNPQNFSIFGSQNALLE